MIKYIELFAGIGGFRYGMENIKTQEKRVWKENKETIRNGKNKSETKGYEGLGSSRTTTQQHLRRTSDRQFTCVYSNEWDKYAAQIYKKHYGECDTRDIRTVKSSELPDFDLLVGGFPCQAFSIAGKRRGFDDTRGTLFFEVARILRDKRPRYFILENVKGLLSHDSGKTFQTILGVLTDLGYEFEWQVLNSKNFGVPQNRERVFIMGHLRGTSRPKVFPITGTGGEDNRNIGEDLSYAIDANYAKGTNTLEKGRRQLIQLNKPKHSNNRVYGDNGIGPTLNTAQGGNRQPKIATYRHSMKGFKGYEEMSPSIKSSLGSGNQILVNKIRRLTPTECARLQGFPDDWCKDLSDTQQYKCYGNAVTTNVITAIIERMI